MFKAGKLHSGIHVLCWPVLFLPHLVLFASKSIEFICNLMAEGHIGNVSSPVSMSKFALSILSSEFLMYSDALPFS